MGEVYLAKLTGAAGFEKLCIVKTILQRMSADKQFVDRFHHEARVLVQLTHANIAQVYDMGELDQSFYMAMEYIAGVDLSRIEERARDTHVKVPVPIGLYIGQKIAEALGYAHRKVGADGTPLNIVHRDVSPQNAMVSYEGDIKVIDFGLAKSAARSKHTQPSTVLGKLGYMSPEQARGESVNHTSDIYSCGVVVWELLAGRQLFLGETVGEMVALMSNPRIPSLRELRPEISEGVDRALLRALATNPTERYPRADDFARALNEQLVREGASVGGEEVGNYVRGLCPEEFVEQRKLISRLSTVGKPGSGEHANGAPSQAFGSGESTAAADADGFGGTAIRTTPRPGEGFSGTSLRNTPAPPAVPAAPAPAAPSVAAGDSFTLTIPKRRAPMVIVLALVVVGVGAGLAVLSRPTEAPAAATAPVPSSEPVVTQPPPVQKPEPREPTKPAVVPVASNPPPVVAVRTGPRRKVEVKKAYEIFVDRGEHFLRAGTAEGLVVGARVQVVGPAHGKKRELIGEATAMEVWPHLARLALDPGVGDPKEVLFGAFDPRARPVRAAAVARDPSPPPAEPEKQPPVAAAVVPEERPEPVKPEPPPVKALRGRAYWSGLGPLKRVNLQNSDSFEWTRCEVRLPTNQRYVFDAIPAGESDGTLLRKFNQDGVERDVDIDRLTVKCVEGSASFAIR